MSRINEFIKIPGSKEILYILEQYAGRPLHEMEQEFIAVTVMEDGWNFDMIDEVASHVADEGAFNFVGFKHLVTQMADDNCKTMEDIKAYLKSLDNSKDAYKQVAKELGRREIVGPEKKYVDRWIVLHPIPIIIEAIRKAVMCTNQNQIMYADKILETWRQKNIGTIEEVRAFENEMRKQHEERAARKVEYKKPAVQTIVEYPNNPLYHKFTDEVMKACPFCGSEDILLQSQFSVRAQAYYRMVTCNTCNAKTRSIKDDAATNPDDPRFWNTVVVNEVKTLWNSRV